MISTAEERGLDFYVLTDHDTDQMRRFNRLTLWDDPDYRPDIMALFYGVEWTSGYGHANVWATHKFDYSALYAANVNENADAAIKVAHEENARFSINHPANPIFPALRWGYAETELVDSIEVWNGWLLSVSLRPYYLQTDLDFWDNYLLRGRLVTGVGGSDAHDNVNIGYPTTWVHATELSSKGILEGIKSGHVFISRGPEGPLVYFEADVKGDGTSDGITGDEIVSAGGIPIKFEAVIHGTGRKPKDLTVRMVKNGLYSENIFYSIVDGFVYEFTDKPTVASYYRMEIHDNEGLLTLTNPIYVFVK